MQNQLSPNKQTKLQEMAHSLFKSVLSSEKIHQYTSLQPDQIKIICRQGGKLFHRKLKKKPNQIMAFLSGYHQLIMGYTDKVANQIINSMSLHFLLLSSYGMIQNGQRGPAKQLLKKALNYLDSTDPDPILLTTALNNLCILWMQDKKYYKAVNVLLQMVKLMQGRMRTLKTTKNKSQAMQDSVFLINSYLLLCKCLDRIKMKNSTSFYKQLYHHSSQMGLKKALKYLGKQSFLTKKFMELTEKDFEIQLPIFRQEQSQKSTYEEKLMKHLVKIEQMLSTPREPIIVKEVVQPPPPPQISDLQDLVCQCSRMINNWHVQIQILKEKGQRLGSIALNCKKGHDWVNLIIGEERMFRLLTQMNISDILPEECSLANLTPKQLIQYCIFNFLYIDDNKNIEIFPRAHCYASSFDLQMFNKDYIVFLYHIRNNDFRLAYGPKNESTTTLLQLQFVSEFINAAFEIKEETDQRILKLYQNLMQVKGKQNKMQRIEEKVFNVKDQRLVVKTMSSILKKFETFLRSLKQQVQLKEIFKQENEFYKFIQVKDDHENGRFYFIRFLKNIKGFEVNIENTYETHSPEGKTKAKGQILYNSYQFFRDFGIPSSTSLNKFRCFCQILSKKYDIKSYQNPLTSRDIEIYQQNSINEVKIAFKTYLRKMYEHRNFILPVTACIMSINNTIPVGIKLTGYNPVLCYQVGFFVHLEHEAWKWPEKPEEQPQDYLNNVVEQYGYKREYFLVDWLERIGFRKIIGLLRVDEKDCFYIAGGHSSNFMRMASIIDLIR